MNKHTVVNKEKKRELVVLIHNIMCHLYIGIDK